VRASSAHGAKCHDDAIQVGSLRIQRVVLIKGVVPHGGPQVIAFETQDQLKDFLIKLVFMLTTPAREVAPNFSRTQPLSAGDSS